MGRTKGSTGIKHRKWSVEEKIKIIRLHLNDHQSLRSLEKEFQVNTGSLHVWIKRYLEGGEEGLKPKDYQRCSMVHLYRKKTLTKLEKLELENFKLRIENERLKKGYTVKGVGSKKEYVPISKTNTKSSKN